MKQTNCKFFRRFFLSLSLLLIVGVVAAAEFPRITAAEYAVDLREEEMPLSVQELGRYALLLSGVEEDELSQPMNTIASLIEGLQSYSGFEESERDKGDVVLQYMHETISRQYREAQTRLDVFLQTGVYNCVSSAVLYTMLARSVGITVRTVYTSDHVFCKVKTPEGDTDVETTNPYGYNPGEKKEFHDKFGRTGYTYVPPGNYRKRTEDDDRRLLSFILQNRISAFEKAKQYGKAVPLAVDRYTVLGTEKAEEAMVKEFVNYLSLLNEQRQIEAAFTFLDMVEKKYGPDPKYEKITYVLVNNTVTQYINNEQFDRAVSFLGKKREQGDISQEKYSEFKSRVEGRRIHVKVHSLPIDEAIHFVEKSYREDRVGKDRYGEYVSYLYVKKAEQTANQEGWLAAVDIVDAGLEKLPGNRKLQEAKSVFEHNYAARVHNRFARLFNEGSYDEAKRVIESALEKLPESSLLQRDLSTVEQALSQS